MGPLVAALTVSHATRADPVDDAYDLAGRIKIPVRAASKQERDLVGLSAVDYRDASLKNAGGSSFPSASGVLIDKRLVLTCGHCRGLSSDGKPIVDVLVFARDGSEMKGRLISHSAYKNIERPRRGGGTDELHDIGVIHLAADAPLSPTLRAAAIDLTVTLEKGDEVLMVGYSKDHQDGSWPHVYSGVVFALEGGDKNRAIVIKPNGGIWPGDSGGPAFVRKNGELKLVGVNSQSSQDRSIATFTLLKPYLDFIDEHR